MGLYICIEGMDFCGKSTLAKYISNVYKARMIGEPFAETPEGKAFKDKLVSNQLTLDQEIQGFATARVEAFTKVIQPTLEADGNIVSDRNFFSSMVYQSDEVIGMEEVFEVNRKLLETYNFNIIPDVVFFIDINHEEFMRRLNKVKDDGREINAKDLMFTDKEKFDLYRERYIQAFDYITKRYGTPVYRLTPDMNFSRNIAKILRWHKEQKK